MSDLDPNPIFDATVLDRGLVPDPPVVTRGGMNRPDVRLLPLVGPQSPGEAW